jgi:diguanylate cyclase (GGDEF)-like protein
MASIEKTISRLLATTVLIILAMMSQAHANNTLDGETIIGEISLLNYFSMYEDKTKQLNVHDVINPQISSEFRPAPAKPSLGFTESAIWLRATIKNSSNSQRRYLIRHDDSTADYIDFYSSSDAGWDRMTGGDRVAFKQRPLDFIQPIFPLDIAAHSSKAVLIRVATKGQTIIYFGINNEPSLLKKISEIKTFSGLFFGGIFTLLIYNLFRFLGTPSSATGYYLCYLVSTGLCTVVTSGLSFKYIWPNNPDMANNILLLAIFLTQICWIQFSRRILSLNIIAPAADNVARYLIWGFVLLILTIPILDYGLLSLISWLALLLCLLYLIALGGIALSSGEKPAKFYIAAMSVIVIGFLISSLRNEGIVDNTVFMRAALPMALLIGLTLFSLTLSINAQQDNRFKYIDPITQLFNRVYFFERMETEFEIAFHQQHSLCLLLINLDQLSDPVQSSSGFGNNRLMKNVAYQTEQILRKIHVAARFNQDELAVILPNTPAESAKIIAERIRIAVEDSTTTTLSIGIACYNNIDRSNRISDHNQLLESADQAMYRAITNGGNRIQMYVSEGAESYQGRCITDPQ